MSVQNSNNFSNLTAKTVPVGSDIIMIADSAAGNAPKQTTINDIIANNVTSGGVVLISAQNISAQPHVSFNNLITSTYEIYWLEFDGLLTDSSPDQLTMQFGTGSTPTWATTNYVYMYANTNALQSPTTNVGASIAELSETVFFTTSTANGQIKFGNLNSSSLLKTYYGQMGCIDSTDPSVFGMLFNGGWNSTTVVTSIRLQFSGNISGNFYLYALVK